MTDVATDNREDNSYIIKLSVKAFPSKRNALFEECVSSYINCYISAKEDLGYKENVRKITQGSAALPTVSMLVSAVGLLTGC